MRNAHAEVCELLLMSCLLFCVCMCLIRLASAYTICGLVYVQSQRVCICMCECICVEWKSLVCTDVYTCISDTKRGSVQLDLYVGWCGYDGRSV